MKRETEEFLNVLFWSADMLMRPTFRRLTDSYESWAYQNGLLPRVSLLEKKQLLERDPGRPKDRVYRLTARGRLHALGGRDPQARWARKWDGRWRLVLFDVPVGRDSHRRQLRRYLHERRFGCLQGSVWVTPDLLAEECRTLTGTKVNVGSLLMMDARPCAGESDTEIVDGAWDFDRINGRYTRLLKVLDRRPEAGLTDTAAAKALLRWSAAEREAWLDAVTNDPLLPERILPAHYLGQTAWRRRVEVLRQASRQLQTYKLDPG